MFQIFLDIIRKDRAARLYFSALASIFVLWLLGNGFLNGLPAKSVAVLIDYEIGHLKISGRIISPVLDKLKKYKEVKFASPRIKFPVIVQNADLKIPALCYGVDLLNDRHVFKLRIPVISDDEVILGWLLAEKLGLKNGDYIYLISSPEKNSLAAANLRVKSVIKTNYAVMDKQGAVVSLKRAALMQNLPAEVSEIDLRLRNKNLSREFVSRLKDDFRQFSVSSWHEADFGFLKLNRFVSKIRIFWNILGLVLIFLLVLLYLAFFRPHDFKTGLILSGGGILGGVACGWGLNLYFTFFGCNFTLFLKNISLGYPLTGRLYSVISLLNICGLAAGAALAVLAAGVISGWITRRKHV